MSFEKLDLIEHLHKALKTEGYERPTPIQREAIPIILQHKDLLGCAQTGTGKTAAFALPILQILHKEPHAGGAHPVRALILSPTRELAIQIGESFTAYGKHTGLRHAVIYGGVSQHAQTNALKRGVDILIATPGRLLDLMQQKFIRLDHIKIFVLDEADRMLDMGFIADVSKIVAALPVKRQTLMFSATMPAEILGLAHQILTHPVKVEVTPGHPTVDAIRQAVYFVDKHNKRFLLAHVLRDASVDSALIFTRTKYGADRVARDLNRAGIHAEAIHGNKSQQARQRALNDFKAKRTRVLVATDIAARGIDVENISHVINFEMPNVAETYIHRIGRTGRAGASGIALSFCDWEERPLLRAINRLLTKPVTIIEDHPYPSLQAATAPSIDEPRKVFSGRSRAFKGRRPSGKHRPGKR